MQEPNPELPQSPTSDLQAVTAAYSDIVEHNSKRTGFRAMFGGMLKGLMESNDVIDLVSPDAITPKSAEEVYKGVDEKMQEGVVEGDMNAELQDIFHSDWLCVPVSCMTVFGELIWALSDAGDIDIARVAIG